jgi:hypothetical protein
VAGIRIAWLVAPGARSPVSSEPSFNRTRCTTASAFLNTTICPPTDAGFGENDWAPFWLRIVMVIAPDVFVDEGAGPPPELPPQDERTRAADNTGRPASNWRRIDTPSPRALEGSKSDTAEIRPIVCSERRGELPLA